ncbi:MAG: sugar phosphate isomerase/epimerase family protein [Terracidiphilus sp.]|jgi:sugar phosphate isomerase/epimerase
MMKISFSTLACPSWTMTTVIEQAHALGYDGIELRFIEDSDRLWELPELSGSGLKQTRDRLASIGLKIPCVDTSCFFHFPEESRRLQSLEMGRAMVDLAFSLGAPGIRVFGDRVQPGADLPSTAAWVADGIHQLAEFARPAGVEVWLESHGEFARGSETMSVLRAADCANTGILWDPLNAYSEFGEELGDGWSRVASVVRHVHIKDAHRIDGALSSEPWNPVLIGEGDFPAHELVALLRQQGYQRFVSLEWEKRWHPHIPDPEIALPHFIQWMRAALES